MSLSLVGLLTLVAFSGLRLASDAWARTDRHSQAAGEVDVAQRLFRQAIEQAYPGIASVSGAPSSVTFRGDAGSLELSAPVPRDLAPGGRHRLYFFQPPGESDVTMAWTPERNQKPLGAAPAHATHVTVLTGVSGLSFAYFGLARGEPGPRWHREWVDQLALPQLVRVEARLNEGSLARWTVLDAAPRADVDATCVVDPLSRRCRGR